MLKLHSTKLILFFFLFTALSPMYCMEPQKTWDSNIILKFAPLRQPNDPILTEKRKACIDAPIIFTQFPKNIILKERPIGTRPGVCYNVAMKECLGLSETQFKRIEQSILGIEEWTTHIGMPYNFFDQKEFPEKGYLATYKSSHHSYIQHFGTVTENGRIKSKIGTSNYTTEHDYFDLPDWGNLLCFWQLKPIYHDEEGKNKLFSEIMTMVEHSDFIKLALQYAQITLFAAAAEKQCEIGFPKLVEKGNPHHLIQGIMGLKLDLPNNNGETALMIAAKKGNPVCVKVLIEHGANPDLKNRDGHNALALAQQKYTHVEKGLVFTQQFALDNPQAKNNYYILQHIQQDYNDIIKYLTSVTNQATS